MSAAPPVVAGGTLTACNGEENAGGTGVRCTITVTNYVTNTGGLAATPESTWTVTRCTGAAGVIAPPAAGGTCTTTTLPITGVPISTVQQCNGSGSGGGGGVWCTVTITNHFTTGAATPATVYECVSVPLTPGLVCDPTAGNNTAASVTAATVGQCNGSGNGGGLVAAVPAGSPHCSVGVGSTTNLTLPVHVDQCNGSANGGGAFIKCTATVTNNIVAPPPPPEEIPEEIEVVVPVIPPPAAPPPVVVVVPVATGVVPVAPPQTLVLPPVVVTPGVPRIVLPPVVVPPGVVQVIVPVVPPPGTVPVIVTQILPPIIPSRTGNAGFVGADPSAATQTWLLGLGTVGLLLGARRLVARREVSR